MALVNIDSLLRITLQKLENIRPPQGIELLSYKRNRSIAVFLLPDGTFRVREHGYREEEVTLGQDGLAKHLKQAIKCEFPRSRKVRLYNLENPGELGQNRKKL
jgi:hypothetical protein